MEDELVLQCPHVPKTYRIAFACKVTGNYNIELCNECYQTEDKDFLIMEKKIVS